MTTLRNLGLGTEITEDTIIEECQHLIQYFESYRGKPFESKTEMNAAVANVIVSVLFGKRFDHQDAQFMRHITMIGEIIKLFGTPSIAEKDKSTDNFSDDNMVVLVSNLFVAGVETTATTLRWGILLMMRYPEIQDPNRSPSYAEKVHDEIAQVVGSAQPRIAHRAQMPYTDAVIHEVQRFANILPTGLPRATTTNVLFRNYYIPKGTEVIPLLSSVLWDQTQWETPDTFNPGHFLDSAGKFMKKKAFMPFSAGRRVCAGASLAKMELFLFFTSLLQKFTFQPPPGISHLDLDITPNFSFLNRPMPHKICALPRT
ncbi:cytochrome P450 2F2-like protein [Camelus ferus]|nr:cytochrome P450 2F2-like protein [Camelus ferus]